MITKLNEAELEETFSRSSGPGGQNVNKVSTRVTLRHIPTNVTVTIQETRTQAENRKLARERLLEALQSREREARNAVRERAEKIRRQNSKRPRGLKERILRTKKHRAGIKKDRRFGGGD
jgi:protein subunit release factor B